ncbi:hypothetical protein [Sphingomonas sp. PAMC 26617]|uniref:hypothetical protein n=1 Tax=Sphingomonas sp. PAMC 26617 TaxID=1112216 RepID=UPI00031562F3|nr:hypothetical protein [Sphingomonas sp. PAMC 26617]
MARLAIVSTYNENCGNASYTHVLKVGFTEFVEVDVIPLDLFLLQKKADLFRDPADKHIKGIAKMLENYDYVNIQFEAGLFGASIPDIRRRIGWLIEAAPNLILTMHRIDVGHIQRKHAISDAFSKRSLKPWKKYAGGQKYAVLYHDIIEMVQKAAKTRNAWIKVHTRRERRVVRDIYNFKNCFDYPLAFLNDEQRADALKRFDRAAFLKKHGFKETDKVFGLFGYISEYKGIETAIQALGELPNNYKLAFFGSHHPQSIRANTAVHPYIESLIDMINDVDEEIYDADLREARLTRMLIPTVNIARSGPAEKTEGGNSRSADRVPTSERVRFIGTLDDPEFIEALRLCDATVLPYTEVGQSMSGVVVLGMEAGAKLICANNHSFSETKKYFGTVFSSFDMGNYVELAQKIRFCAENPSAWLYADEREEAYAKYNIRDSIVQQLTRFGHKFN